MIDGQFFWTVLVMRKKQTNLCTLRFACLSASSYSLPFSPIHLSVCQVSCLFLFSFVPCLFVEVVKSRRVWVLVIFVFFLCIRRYSYMPEVGYAYKYDSAFLTSKRGKRSWLVQSKQRGSYQAWSRHLFTPPLTPSSLHLPCCFRIIVPYSRIGNLEDTFS